MTKDISRRTLGAMIDLETMGNAAGAPILEIGAVAMDMDALCLTGKRFSMPVSLESCMRAGLAPDASTILWWMEQSDAARGAVVAAQKSRQVPAADITHALVALAGWFSASVGEEGQVWSKGASFDLPILEHAYKRCGMAAPWRFWNHHCFRTKMNERRDVVAPKFEGVRHSGLADAEHQALHLFEIKRAERGGAGRVFSIAPHDA